MTADYNIPTFLGSDMTREQVRAAEYESACREILRLIRDGVLHPDFVKRVYDVQPSNLVITFGNTLNGVQINASIFYLPKREDGAPRFTLNVSSPAPTPDHEDETISISSGDDLHTMVLRGKSLILSYVRPGKDRTEKVHQRKTKDALLQIRIDAELKKEFEQAVTEQDESQARILRKLIQFYLGKGPDPRPAK